MKQKTLLALILILALAVSMGGCFAKSDASETSATTVQQKSAASADTEKLNIGDSAPDFTATLANGDTFTLSEHKDEVVLVNFWGTWCAPCVRELPTFAQLAQEGYTLVAVNCAQDKATVDAFINDNGYTFPIAYDEGGSICTLYHTTIIPYTLIIRDGVIQNSFLGVPNFPYQEYKKAIEACQ